MKKDRFLERAPVLPGFRLLSGLLLAGALASSTTACGYNEIIDRDEQVKASEKEPS